jgi:hypothetical protein
MIFDILSSRDSIFLGLFSDELLTTKLISVRHIR